MNGMNKPAYIVHQEYRFLIFDAPTDGNLDAYIVEFQRHNVRTIARACEPTYSVAPLTRAGIRIVEVPFNDGDPPPDSVVSSFLDVVDEEFADHNSERRTIGIHCVAGLGRAPVLVGVALIERGMDALDAIEFIRRKRRGAINSRQIKFLEAYTPRKKKSGPCCALM